MSSNALNGILIQKKNNKKNKRGKRRGNKNQNHTHGYSNGYQNERDNQNGFIKEISPYEPRGEVSC